VLHLVKPVLQAILVAEQVYEDRSGRRVIAGTFNGLVIGDETGDEVGVERDASLATPPSGTIAVGAPVAYLNVAGLHGPAELTLRYVDVIDNSVLFRIIVSLSAPDSPLDTVELTIPLPQLPIPHAGSFALEVLHGDNWLGSYVIKVVRASAPEHAS
jgi:hypothetical protein